MINPELRLRIISAVFMALGAMILAWIGGFPYRLACVLLGGFILWEWLAICRHRLGPVVSALGAWLIFGLAGIFLIFAQVAIALFIVAIGAVSLVYRSKGQFAHAWISSGLFYAGFSMIALTVVRGRDTEGLWALTFVLAIVWASDIFAYFAGRSLRGPKLAPAISPGKTVSGAVFGTLAGLGAGLIVALLAGGQGGLSVPVVAIGLSIMSQLGDLGESWFKRLFGVKDSGSLIPGHGGVMDRVDGLVAAASAAAVLTLLGGSSYFLSSLIQNG